MEQKPSPIIVGNYDPRALAEAGAKLYLVDEHGNTTSSWILLKGADSDTFQEAANERARKRSQSMAKSRRRAVAPDELQEDMLELHVAVTEEWGELYSALDAPLECNAANARALYRGRPDIFEQVVAFVAGRDNFLASAASS